MDVVVETKSGKIRGEKRENLFLFKGVPYACPPIGPLRWAPPKEKEPWKGIIEAKEYGCICPQPEFEFFKGMSFRERQSEDCLYLNIYTPGIDGKKRPVMVWIHGGAFTIGSSSHPLYRKGKMAIRGDVVLVTINYRLGPFGFLRLKEIGNGKIGSTGNEGLLDQICAIKWVRENIEVFGGDPDNITLFGESAGAISIASLLAMEGSQGLFKKVVLQSVSVDALFDRETSNFYAREFLKISGVDEEDVEKLREFSPEELIKSAEVLLRKTGELTVFSPTIDGETLKDRPLNLMEKERIKDLPLLVGTNANEWNLFVFTNPKMMSMDMDDLKRMIGKTFPSRKAEEIIRYYYGKLKNEGSEPEAWMIYSRFMTDTFFLLPTLRTVEKWVSSGSPVFLYFFDWPSPLFGGKLGACHTIELGFLFGNYDERFFGSGKDADELSEKMQDAWTSFARSGNPSCESLGVWPDYGKDGKVMILGKRCYLAEDLHRETREFYSSLMEGD